MSYYPKLLNMKKLFATMLVASSFIMLQASAQPPGGGPGRGGMAISKQTLMDSLQISSENADSVVAIRSAAMTQMRSIMTDQSASMDDKRAKAKPIRDEMQTNLKKFLTEDQMKKLHEMEMNMRQNGKPPQQQ